MILKTCFLFSVFFSPRQTLWKVCWLVGLNWKGIVALAKYDQSTKFLGRRMCCFTLNIGQCWTYQLNCWMHITFQSFDVVSLIIHIFHSALSCATEQNREPHTHTNLWVKQSSTSSSSSPFFSPWHSEILFIFDVFFSFLNRRTHWIINI